MVWKRHLDRRPGFETIYRTGDGGSDFQNFNCINFESYVQRLVRGTSFELVQEWLLSAERALFDNEVLFAFTTGEYNAFLRECTSVPTPRQKTSWALTKLRSYVFHRTDPNTCERVYTPGVAYGAYNSLAEETDRVVMDMRTDDEAGFDRCELCTQAKRQPSPGHARGARNCPIANSKEPPREPVLFGGYIRADEKRSKQELKAMLSVQIAGPSHRHSQQEAAFRARKKAERRLQKYHKDDLLEELQDAKVNVPAGTLVAELRRMLMVY
eukprot:g31448.t1